MSRKLLAQLVACVMLVGLVSVPAIGADDEAPKYKIKDVMKKAFKGPLVKKVGSGNASDEEKKELHAMMEAMAKSKPPKGDDESWKKLTSALVKASKGAVDGDDKAAKGLRKAANCKACHSQHKP